MTVRFLVSGLVQGVGYRYFVARHADRMGLTGWARNLADGQVEVVVQGPQGSVDALETELRRGPRLSRVEAVAREDVSDEVKQLNTFTVR